MKRIGMLNAMRQCSAYRNMSEAERAALRQRRLQDIITFAKENSPYYQRLYRDIDPQTCELNDLPAVSKRALMAHFDEWPTDRGVTLAGLTAFMENLDNVGRKYQNKYLVFTTSGSTGNPLVAIYDDNANNVMGAIAAMRSYARPSDMRAFIRRGGRSIGVFATGGFYLSNGSVRARLVKMPWKKRQFAVTSALLPMERIVAELNAFQPAMLGGYPSNLELLIDEALVGRLHISPVIIMTGGEYLSDALRERLAETFACYVQTSYSCTEGGTVACECTERHFHINDDWLIVEPVDSRNRPVPDGVQSDKILLTNLYNYAQPYIRYEVTDRVVMHHEPCPCGNPSPWLELEGRTDDMLILTDGVNVCKVPPLAVYAVLKEVHALRRFQLAVHPHNRLELRLEPADGLDRQAAFLAAKAALTAFLSSYGAPQADITLSDELPKQHPISGKFKHIVNMA